MDIPFHTKVTTSKRPAEPAATTYPYAKRIWQFAGLLALAVVVRYFSNTFVQTIFYLGLLLMYFRSKDESFWLATILTLSAGFMGFFGKFEAGLSIIPGLPAVELAQFYIILTVVKAQYHEKTYRPFYTGFIWVLLIYIIFLMVQGFAVGFPPGLNRKFALIKVILPLALLYSIPILFDSIDKYRATFSLLFLVALSSLFSQIFAISLGGTTPAEFIGAKDAGHLFMDITEGLTYRGIFSEPILLITMLGAMAFLALDRNENKALLYTVLLSNLLAVFLSATRGFIISYALMLFLFSILVLKLHIGRILQLSAVATVFLVIALNIPTIKQQAGNAFDRLTSLQAVVEGDASAGGSLRRLTERGPRVMKMWSESKLTGFGFSEIFREYRDMHVANQTILLHGGIVGLLLLYGFFLDFNFRLWRQSLHRAVEIPLRRTLLVFPIFFLGWFFIHSTSGQQFGFTYEPITGMQLAIFLGMGSLVYHQAERSKSSAGNHPPEEGS